MELGKGGRCFKYYRRGSNSRWGFVKKVLKATKIKAFYTYPAHDDNANIAVFKLPIKWYINLEYKKVLSIDFSRLSTFLKLENSTNLNLKKNFKVATTHILRVDLKKK